MAKAKTKAARVLSRHPEGFYSEVWGSLGRCSCEGSEHICDYREVSPSGCALINGDGKCRSPAVYVMEYVSGSDATEWMVHSCAAHSTKPLASVTSNESTISLLTSLEALSREELLASFKALGIHKLTARYVR